METTNSNNTSLFNAECKCLVDVLETGQRSETARQGVNEHSP